jgi:hypothetical protein
MTETDPLGGTNYTISGTSQILSVPYALHANSAAKYAETDPVFAVHPSNAITATDITNWNNKLDTEVDGSVTNEIQTLSISNDTIFLSNGGFVKLPVGMPPVATVQATSNVGESFATLNGVVNAKGMSTVVVFEWGLTTDYGNKLDVNQSPVTGSSNVNVSADLTGLVPASTYHYRIKAYNAVNVAFSEDLSFIAGFSAPQLSTAVATVVLASSAVLGGNIVNDGGSAVTERGVCYGKSSMPTIESDTLNCGTGTGNFVASATGLEIGTTYYVRAYAVNSIGTSYGNEVSFTTVALPTLTTSAFTDVNGTSVKAGGSITGNGGGILSAQGLCWSTSSTPTIENSLNTSFTDAMTGLTPYTVYYVRAYATNEAGTAYGNEISFNSGYEIGSVQLGGLVFYNNGTGNGLVCASTDQSTGAKWGCYGTLIGTTSLAVGTGAANTSAITGGCITTDVIAAKVCDALALNTFSDWYLPSIEELNLMYQNLDQKNLGGFSPVFYWSSSEDNVALAWYLHFGDGSKLHDGKDYPVYVRAVRSF